MSELVPEDKELLVLRFVENKSQEEAAEIISSTRMKIRTAESKLRRRLKAFMRGTGYTDHMKGASGSKSRFTRIHVDPSGHSSPARASNPSARGFYHHQYGKQITQSFPMSTTRSSALHI